MSKNICFYSNKCKLCEAILTELAQTSYKNEFQYICVDPSPNRPKLPGFLKKVPTFVIQGEADPLVGNEAMNWLWIKKMQDNGAKSTSKSSQSSVKSDSGNDGDMGLSFWNQHEMGGGGDTYSFLDQDTSVEGNGGYQISQNFEFIGGGGGGNGSRETMGVMPIQKSKKEEAFDSEMERYRQMRDIGVPKQINRM